MSKTIAFVCPVCDETIEVAAQSTRRFAKCPNPDCRQSVKVPHRSAAGANPNKRLLGVLIVGSSVVLGGLMITATLLITSPKKKPAQVAVFEPVTTAQAKPAGVPPVFVPEPAAEPATPGPAGPPSVPVIEPPRPSPPPMPKSGNPWRNSDDTATAPKTPVGTTDWTVSDLAGDWKGSAPVVNLLLNRDGSGVLTLEFPVGKNFERVFIGIDRLTKAKGEFTFEDAGKTWRLSLNAAGTELDISDALMGVKGKLRRGAFAKGGRTATAPEPPTKELPPKQGLASLMGTWKAQSKTAVIELDIEEDGKVVYLVGRPIGGGQVDGTVGFTSIAQRNGRFELLLNNETVTLVLSKDGRSLKVSGTKTQATLGRE